MAHTNLTPEQRAEVHAILDAKIDFVLALLAFNPSGERNLLAETAQALIAERDPVDADAVLRAEPDDEMHRLLRRARHPRS